MDILPDKKLPIFRADSPERQFDGANTQYIVVQETDTDHNNAKVAVVYRVVDGKRVFVQKFPQVYGLPKIDIGPDGMGYVFGGDDVGGIHDALIPGWVRCPTTGLGIILNLIAPWENWGPPFSPHLVVFKMRSGIIMLEGVVKGGGAIQQANQPICILPEGYRPAAQLMFICACGRDGVSGVARVYVLPSGVVCLVFPEDKPLSSLSLTHSFLANYTIL